MPAYTYDPDRNPGLYRVTLEGVGEITVGTPHAIPGVPLRDLSADEVTALPARLQASIAACAFYVAAPDSAALPPITGSSAVAQGDATPEE